MRIDRSEVGRQRYGYSLKYEFLLRYRMIQTEDLGKFPSAFSDGILTSPI